MDDNKIIDDLGGTGKVAALCDVKPPSVSEWRKVGIPKAQRRYLMLLRPDVFATESTVTDGPANVAMPAVDKEKAA